jgi:hypothetical protein
LDTYKLSKKCINLSRVPLSCALVAVSTKSGGGLSLDQGLQPMPHQFGDQFTGGAAAKQLRQLCGGRIRDGHGLFSGRW